MRRHTALYALAATTLAGAFWLTPKPKVDVPDVPDIVPVKTPVVTNTPPITSLLYADTHLSVQAKIDRGMMNSPTQDSLFMDVELAAAKSDQRSDLVTVLVIDRSGSMAGEKIDNARMAAGRFLNRLGEGDKIAVVSYGTDVSIDLRMTELNAQSRRSAQRVIARIEEGGGTNIDGGLRVANRILREAGITSEAARIVLISDGRPTEGARGLTALTRHAHDAHEIGATLSTIGVGLDYNESLMEKLAQTGAGRYHYLRRSSQLSKILDDEVKHASRSVARRVALHFNDSFCGYSFKAAPGQKVKSTNNGAVVSMGDLAAGEVRRVLVEFKPTGESCAQSTPAAPEVVYLPAKKSETQLLANRADTFRIKSGDHSDVNNSYRDDVRLRVLEVNAALELAASMDSYGKGNVEKARRNLKVRRDALNVAAKKSKSTRARRAVQALDDTLQKLDAKPASSKGQDLVKSARETSFNALR